MINQPFPPEHLGGAEIYTLRMSLALRQSGHEAVVLCGSISPSGRMEVATREETLQGIPVTRLIIRAKHSTRYTVHPEVLEWGHSWLRTIRPDVIYCGLFWHLGAVLHAAHEEAIPFFLITHSYDLFCARMVLIQGDGRRCDGTAGRFKCADCQFPGSGLSARILTYALDRGGAAARAAARAVGMGRSREVDLQLLWEMRRLTRWIRLHAAGIIAPSEFTRQLHQRNGYPSEKLHCLPTGLDPALFSRSSRTGPLRTISYVGRLQPLKGVRDFLEAFLHLPKETAIEFRIYGDADHPHHRLYADELKKMAVNDPRVRWMGMVSPDTVPGVLHETDLLVLPSLTEVSPVSIQEALACGVPVLASAVGGIPELVKDGVNGLLFPPGDAAAIQRSLSRLLDEHGLLDRLRQGATLPMDIRESARQLAAFGEVRQAGAS